MTYEEKKKVIENNISNFISNDNLIELAQAYLIIKNLLIKEKFPIREYKKWLNKKN